MRKALELVRRPLGNKGIDQWSLIVLAVEAQLKIDKDVWINSHKRVNTHPSTRVSSEIFLRSLDKRGILVSGEKYFEKRTLFDAMPACWTKMEVPDRHNVLSIIKSIYDKAKDDEPVKWSKEDVVRLAKYVSLADVPKLRACYLVAQQDPSVICATVEPIQADQLAESVADKGLADYFEIKPPTIMEAIKQDPTNTTHKIRLFNHMCNMAAQSAWQESSLEPSPSLCIDLTQEQKKLLNPSYKDVLTGYILYDVKGKGAKQKMAKRRLDMIEGNISSYSRCLNSSKRLKAITECNQLAASMAEVTAELDNQKSVKRAEAAQKVKDKLEKKAAAKQKEDAKRKELLPKLESIMEPFLNGSKTYLALSGLTKSCIVDILKYYYNDPEAAKPSATKDDLLMTLRGHVDRTSI